MSKMWFRPKPKNDKAITIKMTNDQYVSLDFAAKKLMMTKSDLVRSAINDYLCKHL